MRESIYLHVTREGVKLKQDVGDVCLKYCCSLLLTVFSVLFFILTFNTFGILLGI